MDSKRYWLAEDCPNCGQKDAPNAWRGARMGSTAWGHSFSCCSEACGVAYANSPKRWQQEIDLVDCRIEGDRALRKDLVKKLAASRRSPSEPVRT